MTKLKGYNRFCITVKWASGHLKGGGYATPCGPPLDPPLMYTSCLDHNQDRQFSLDFYLRLNTFRYRSVVQRSSTTTWNDSKSKITDIRAVFNWGSKNQNKSNPIDQSKQGFALSIANENSKWKQQNCLKRGKTRMTKASQLFLFLHLIGWEDGASFHSQSQGVRK